MAAICFTLLCTSFPVAFWKENKDSLYLGKLLLRGNCHHMAAILKFKMAATLLDMQFSKRDRCRLHWFLYLHFVLVQMAAIFNFTMTAALPVLFSVIEHTKIHVHATYHSSCRLLIAGSTALAKCGAFQVCLEAIEIPIAILSTCACYKFKASYLSDTQCGPCRYITGSLGCLPSPTSNVWKFRLYFYRLFVL